MDLLLSGDINIGALRSPLIGDFLFESAYVCDAKPRHKHRRIIAGSYVAVVNYLFS